MPDEVVLPVFVSHGTPNAYANYGCRCDLCREAESLYRSQLRARDPEKHTTYMREYMRAYRERKRREKAVRLMSAEPGEDRPSVSLHQSPGVLTDAVNTRPARAVS